LSEQVVEAKWEDADDWVKDIRSVITKAKSR
jgi:hypothetical protein